MKPNLSLKRERERRGWAQAKVAHALGIDPQTVSRWERGVARPYPYLREQLCELFQMDAGQLGLLDQSHTDDPVTHPTEAQETVHLPVPLPFLDPATPLPLTAQEGLVGRAALVEQFKQRLMSEIPGCMTILCGLPGVGKTALATTLAHDEMLRQHFSDGILWAGLGPSPDLTGHLSRWGTLLGCSATATVEATPNETWAYALHLSIGQRRLLVVIDDAWSIDDALSMKVGGSGCAYIITTRVPLVALHFAHDEIYTIPELSEHESLLLLARFTPDLVAHDPDASQELVRMVGGLPLALTLMGKYLRAQLATGQPRRLQHALQQLHDAHYRLHLSQPCALIDRQPSLEVGAPLSLDSIIAVSERHIGSQDRQTLFALSVFPAKPNSFSEDAALAVCQVDLASLDRLCDAGLLESPEPYRYQLHQTIVDYARLRSADDSVVKLRFVTYMVEYVEKREKEYNALEQEYHMIIAALELARKEGWDELYIRGVIAFAAYLEIRGIYPQAIEYLQHAYSLACTGEDRTRMIAILSLLGQLCREQHQEQLAEGYLHEGLTYARQAVDERMVSHFLINLAELLEQRREYALAYRYLQEGQAYAHHIRYEERTFYHRVTTDQARDVMCVYFTEPQEMLRRGYLADIDQLFQSWPHAHSISPLLLDIITSPEEHICGLPVEAYTLGLIYNRKLFREADLDPDTPPTTWDEFRAIAQRLTQPKRQRYGFAEATIHNMGGWRLTNWFYTAGIQPERERHGSWQAAFYDSKAVQLLTMFQEMRFRDESMPRQILLNTHDLIELFGQGRIAMMVNDPAIALGTLYHKGSLDPTDIGLAPMPQNGGNACLLGGLAYVFKAGVSAEQIAHAFQQLVSKYTDLDRYEDDLKAATRAGHAVGIPSIPLFAGPLQQQLEAIEARYCNVPRDNYRLYIQSRLTPYPEPSIAAQKYYAMLDPILQAVLTNPHAQPQRLLEQIAEQFQTRFLAQV